MSQQRTLKETRQMKTCTLVSQNVTSVVAICANGNGGQLWVLQGSVMSSKGWPQK